MHRLSLEITSPRKDSSTQVCGTIMAGQEWGKMAYAQKKELAISHKLL